MRRMKLNTVWCAMALGILGMAGCASKHIVKAAPPSVSVPPPGAVEPMPQPEAPPPTETKAEPPPEAAPDPSVPPLAPVKRPQPPRPRTAPTPDPTPKAAPPQISPQLSARELDAAKSTTTKNLTSAEKNLQLTNGRQLNEAQKDLTGKINAFLAQAHEAIMADDWVRAQSLAEKARVLSSELVKSF
jgi:hypothetical protein